jgi:GAF domain-containing protein
MDGTTSKLEAQFTTILKLSLNALGIDESEGLGTIHLYRPEAETLVLAAHCGCVSNLEDARVQDITSGRPPGIAAWVAMRRRAILVNDLETSRFRPIHVVINKDVKSELAVPMIAGEKLIGVLNLECTRKNAFSHASVRSIWYAANDAATAYQLQTSSQITRSLLDISASAAKDTGGKETLRRIAEVLCAACGADYGDIWHYDSRSKRFNAAASTDAAFAPTIRTEGWSAYVLRTLRPVWLSNIVDETTFTAEQWAANDWTEVIPSDQAPSSVNSKLLTGVKAQLGMPIIASGDCVGVALIKYNYAAAGPSAELMRDVFFYVSQVGLVLEAVQWRLEMPGRLQLRLIGEKLRLWSSSGELNFDSLEALAPSARFNPTVF